MAITITEQQLQEIREKLTFRQKMKARRVAARALIESRGNVDHAIKTLKYRFADEGVGSAALIVLMIRLAIILIQYWLSKDVSNPPRIPMFGEPCISDSGPDEPTAVGQGSPKKLWGTPPKKPWQGSYGGSGDTGTGRFGAKDFASVVANTVQVSPILAGLAWKVETMADETLMQGTAGGTTFITSLAIFAAYKTLSQLLRSHGESLFRNVCAWLWSWVLGALWSWVVDTFFFWLPWVWLRKRRERRDRPYDPHGGYVPHRPSFWDRFRNRREDRRRRSDGRFGR